MKNSVDNLGTASGADVSKPVTGETVTGETITDEQIHAVLGRGLDVSSTPNRDVARARCAEAWNAWFGQPLPLTSAQIADRLTALQEQVAKRGREIRLEAAKRVRDKLLAKASLTDADKIMLAEIEQVIGLEVATVAQPTEKPHPESPFAPGDLVQLRSGGPVMTFCQAQSYGVEVAFMSRDGMQRTFVPVATLMPYKRRLYESDEAPMPPQQPPQQQSDQPKDERLDAILRASERKASALERIAAAIEQIADYMETR